MTESNSVSMSQTEIQLAVMTLWRRVLQIETVGLEDDFFYLGGDSLKAVELMMAVEETFGISLDPVEILEQSTVEAFAAVIFELMSGARTEAALEPDRLERNREAIPLKS